jgi:hypothetical protein
MIKGGAATAFTVRKEVLRSDHRAVSLQAQRSVDDRPEGRPPLGGSLQCRRPGRLRSARPPADSATCWPSSSFGAGGQVLDVPATQAARRAHCPFWSLIR